MNKKAFIFDLDGVIVDTARYHFIAWQQIASQLGIEFTLHDNELLKGVSRVRSLDIILELGKVTASQEDKNIAAEKQAEENRIAEEKQRISDAKPSVTETFHLNGKLKSRTNYQSINDGGERHGIQESYYENGQLDSKLNFKDGKIDGLGESYYENGQLYNKVNYKDGKEDGLRESYYENGQLWFIKNFKDGELHGLSETYFEDGSKYDDACYKNGELTDKSYCKPQ